MSERKSPKQTTPLAVRLPEGQKAELQRLAEVRNTNRNALLADLIGAELEAAKASQELDEKCSA
jgi:predicted transcriptional regulator